MAKLIRASARRTSVRASKKTPASKPSRLRAARAPRKGGPVPGTPSPTRTRMTPELQAHVKRLYEETDQPVCQIALDVGVNESVIRRMGPREGWVRYVAPPRDLPPLATLLAEVEALESSDVPDRHPEVLADGEPRRMAGTTGAVAHGCRVYPTCDLEMPKPAKRTWDGAQALAPQGDGETAEDDGQADPQASPTPTPDPSPQGGGEKEDNIARFIRIVRAHLDEFEAVRRDGKLLPKHHLQTARAISILTEAFNRLQRLRASSNGPIHDDLSDMPADLDAYRLELARQIDAFIASRTDAGVAEDSVATPVDGTET